MKDTRKALGSRGEDLAVQYLKKKGFKVIERNYHCSEGEIDLVAREKNTLAEWQLDLKKIAGYLKEV